MPVKETDFFTPAEAADYLKVTRKTVYDALREGRMNGKKVLGRYWTISPEDLLAYAESR